MARALNKYPSAVTNWETGLRGVKAAAFVATVKLIGMELNAGPALIDMWRSAGSVSVVPSRNEWIHNFAEDGEPVWVWLRPSASQKRQTATLWWGAPVQGQIAIPKHVDGVLIQFPLSWANPSLEVVIDEAGGWVDFGHGVIPAGVAQRLGIPLVDAVTLLKSGPLEQLPPDEGSDDDREMLSYLRLAYTGFRRLTDFSSLIGRGFTRISVSGGRFLTQAFASLPTGLLQRRSTLSLIRSTSHWDASSSHGRNSGWCEN
jgi:hypothetical protein